MNDPEFGRPQILETRPGQSLMTGVMKRTWLDNALIVESTKLLTLAEQIAHTDLDVAALFQDSGLRKVIEQEWESKEARLAQLVEVLQNICRQVQAERELLSAGPR